MMSDGKRAPNAGFFGMRGKKAPLVSEILSPVFRITPVEILDN